MTICMNYRKSVSGKSKKNIEIFTQHAYLKVSSHGLVSDSFYGVHMKGNQLEKFKIQGIINLCVISSQNSYFLLLT